MQEWHLIMEDGFELIITCKDAEITKDGFGTITNIKWNGIKDNFPVKLDLAECKCIYYKVLDAEESEDVQ